MRKLWYTIGGAAGCPGSFVRPGAVSRTVGGYHPADASAPDCIKKKMCYDRFQ